MITVFSKRQTVFLSVVLAGLLLGCGGGSGGNKSSGPEGSVKSFLSSAKAGNYKKAAQCYAPSILKQPGAEEKLIGMMKSSIEEKGGIAAYEITETSVGEDEATVRYVIRYKNGDEDQSRTSCVKEKGKWYLAI